MGAEEFVMKLVASGGPPKGGKREDRPQYKGPEPVEGEVYRGKITGIHQFGVFLEFMPGAEDGSYPPLEGLCHVSELAKDRVRNCEGFVKAMKTEEFDVVYQGLNKNGKRSLSRKAALGKRRRANGEESKKEPVSVMSEQELDVIAKAIEGVQEI